MHIDVSTIPGLVSEESLAQDGFHGGDDGRSHLFWSKKGARNSG